MGWAGTITDPSLLVQLSPLLHQSRCRFPGVRAYILSFPVLQGSDSQGPGPPPGSHSFLSSPRAALLYICKDLPLSALQGNRQEMQVDVPLQLLELTSHLKRHMELITG